MKIGVFDSGIGGLTVLKSLLDHKLFEEIIYYGDTARVPYGSKDRLTISRYALEAVEFFKNFPIDLLIVACNTVSAYALEEMQEVAPFKVIGVVEPGVMAAENALSQKTDNILILGTKATVNSKAYENLLHFQGYTNTQAIATGLFVPIVEENLFEGEVLDSTMRHYFKGIPTPDAIILGCTHFPLIADKISAYFNDEATMIHSGEAIVQHLEDHFDFKHTFDKPVLKFFASENPDGLKEVAHKWLNL